jgi:hypothetical protein
VPEGASLLESQSLRDLDDVASSSLRGEVGYVRSVFGHPVVDTFAERSLRPSCNIPKINLG